MTYCHSPYTYQRRKTREVAVGDPEHGGVVIGGANPVVKQSMLTCDTMDTEACVRQALELAKAGCQVVRLTAPTVNDAANLRNVVARLRAQGCFTPIVADIHFKPEAALEAAKWVDKIRINPGNFADTKKFAIREYTDEQYVAELRRIEERFTPVVQLCKQLGRAMRIGVNHGSLSDRIMNRFGDTPQGMVESAVEFARIARRNDFHSLIFSMKASNPKVMIECYRLLVARLDELGDDWNYPIHLGVTEAGEGEDGRIKSAIGIGSLLCDGIGDTIRVSLTEDSVHEIPVCRDLLAQVSLVVKGTPALETELPYSPFNFSRRETFEVSTANGVACGGSQPVRVVVTRSDGQQLQSGDRNLEIAPEGVYEESRLLQYDPRQPFTSQGNREIVTVKDGLPLPVVSAFRLLALRLNQSGARNPILLKDTLDPTGDPLSSDIALLRASTVLGSLLADGIGDAILVRSERVPGQSLRLAYNILQAVGCRSFKTDYVACPSCGRTLFDLQSVTARIKARTGHLKGLKIAIMGCIVNGPGEMADANFGYVGGAPGKVNLYVGKTPVKFNIPEAEAVDRLVDLIRENGNWFDPKPLLD